MIKYNSFERKLLEELNYFGVPEKGKRVIVGLSGGADSVSLLVSLKRISSSYPLEIFALHLNHMLRGEEADKDMYFAEQLCESISVPFYSKSVNVNLFAEDNKMGIEEAAREVRYSFFSEFSEKNQIDYILTAHNMNDVAETVLFHIIRGCGIKGLCGITRQRDNIIRPLLNFSREEIENYCKELSLNYVTDSTNFDTDYSRNYIRHVILPEMKKLNPSIISSLSRLSESVISANITLNQLEECVNMKSANELSDELLYRRLKNDFSFYSNSQVSYNRFMAVKKAFTSDCEKIISFPDNIECVVKNGDFYFRKKELSFEAIKDTELIFGENVINNILMIEVSNDIIAPKKELYDFFVGFVLNSKQLKGSIRVRSRFEGDSIKIGGMTRKIKKQFIEKRIPREKRDIIPIIYDEEGIICVPELGIADRVKAIGNNNVYIGIHSRKGFR